MKVIVDTSVWSLVLRKTNKKLAKEAESLVQLINNDQVVMIGPIRQEILSGIKSEKQYFALRDQLRAFPDFQINTGDFETAAEYFNKCRNKGIQGSNTDFLICAVAVNNNFLIFTSDKDFLLYSKLLKINIFEQPNK